MKMSWVLDYCIYEFMFMFMILLYIYYCYNYNYIDKFFVGLAYKYFNC
jgi:hypothetical protein